MGVLYNSDDTDLPLNIVLFSNTAEFKNTREKVFIMDQVKVVEDSL